MIIKESLESDEFRVKDAENGNVALKLLEKEKFDLMITDLMMPGIKGIELLNRAKKMDSEIGVLLMSAYGTVETAVDAMKEGAFDFVTKPFSISHIESRVKRFFEFSTLKSENTKLKKQLAGHKIRNKFVGESKAALDLKYHIDIVSHSNATVFLKGESGTGKEVVAEAIHTQSERADKPFLKINCAAVPETLFESTLFGHMKGSFSGAHKDQKGIFEECDGGTLLLDEISEIPQTMQAKLLRVIQEMCIVRVGNTTEIPVDVRIIATTNKDISELVNNGKFREDLFFRLNVFPIEMPTLKERKSDIPLLINYFLELFSSKYKYDKKTINSQALEKLSNYNWPGNIRQLHHLLERAILFSGKESEIGVKHLKLENDLEPHTNSIKAAEVMPLAEMEKRLIFAALKKTNNHRTQAAELLGITVRTLRNKLHLFEQDGSIEAEN
ncbi:MAG: sigma-54-dependent Fis family transcriptional regulator [Calditrichaeota bacterium]|nr:MAG: sigma-54-dependent Fis family transcriptional regulator [Calditrichota bacterium]MBL1203992.1 sigma-54-dependent Fis family transcriptional regulator [Calditrichota bacterium]NOG43823.1 sigma-54-dependent Fis family transcriptional regulator [Calditrichota bacterium]